MELASPLIWWRRINVKGSEKQGKTKVQRKEPIFSPALSQNALLAYLAHSS
jgi:hypothetical protein